MKTPLDGFWQVLFDDDDEDVIPFRETTIAIRASACWVYAGGHYMEMATAKHREVIDSWPPDDELSATLFKTNRSVAGRFTWEQTSDGLVVEHVPSMSLDPRTLDRPYRHVVRIDGDTAVAHPIGRDQSDQPAARWRRLSGRGSSPLAGAWTSEDAEEWWLYLVTAGHYAVMRSDFGAVAPRATGEEGPTDAEAAALFRARSMNAGAHLVSSKTFDHWPMFSSTAGYGVTKHPTFYMPFVSADEFQMAFERDDDAPGVWRRLG